MKSNPELKDHTSTNLFSKIAKVIFGPEKNEVDNEITQLIEKIKNASQMVPSKKVILLNNLQDQLKIKNNTSQIEQIQKIPFNYNQPQMFNPGLHSDLQVGFFSLSDGQGQNAVVDFANSKFGGGVVGPNGFSQEEKMLMETNLVSKAWQFQGLDQAPLYIKALQTHQFHGPGVAIYGNSLQGSKGNQTIDKVKITADNLANYYCSINPPRKVNIIAMAALDMRKKDRTEYQLKDYYQMFEIALKGFKKHADHGGLVVHSGAWGAGVFRNSENVTCVLQILAAQAAGVKLIYHGSLIVYSSAIRFLKGSHIVGQEYHTVFTSLCDFMQKKHNQKKFWRPQ